MGGGLDGIGVTTRDCCDCERMGNMRRMDGLDGDSGGIMGRTVFLDNMSRFELVW